MLINVGLRTDIACCYPEWLMRRIEAGYAYARNPLFPNKVTAYDLSPDRVDALLFCSKNYAPLLPRIGEILKRYRTYFFCTVTPYGAEIEPGSPPLPERIQMLKELSRTAGREKVVWRYDPILITEEYTVSRHLELFLKLAGQIAPHVHRCVISFVEMFVKLRMRMPELIPLTREQKRELACGIGTIAAKFSLPVTVCGSGDDYSEYGVMRRGCVTLDDVAAANGCAFRKAPHLGNRRGCGCIASRDLGWYDSCPLGCRYCNANRDPALVKENLSLHDDDSPMLIGNLRESDTLLYSPQDSYLKNDGRQLSLFDL